MKKSMLLCPIAFLLCVLVGGCPAGISRYTYDGWLWPEQRLGAEYEGTDIWQLPDGGFLLLASLFGGDKHAFVVRLGADGGVKWSRDFPEIDAVSATAPQGTILSDTSLVVIGTDDLHSSDDNALRATRLSSQGESIWFNRYDDFGLWRSFGALGASLSVTGDVLCTSFVSPHDNGVIKLSDDGSTVWQSQFPVDWIDDSPPQEGVSKFSTYSVCADSGGGAVMCGKEVENNGPALLKVDSQGKMNWYNAYQIDDFREGLRIAQTQDGGYIVGVKTSYSPPAAFKVDSEGNFLWKIDHLTPGPDDVDESDVRDMEVDHDGNIVMVGEAQFFGTPNPLGGTPVTRRAYISKFTPDGTVLWFKKLDAPGEINGVGIKNDGGYVTAGITGNVQLQVIHFDTNGNIVDVP